MFIMHPKDANGMAESRLYDLRLQFCPDVFVAVLRIFMLLLFKHKSELPLKNIGTKNSKVSCLYVAVLVLERSLSYIP